MSHISVRLTQAVVAVVAAVLVGGSTTEVPQPEEPASQPQAAKVQSAPVAEVSQQSVSILDARRSKCSAPSKGEGTSQLLARLVREIEPKIGEQELRSLTSDPGGSLVSDLRTHEPVGDASMLNVADTVCVIRAVSSSSVVVKPNGPVEVVWYTHMPGFDAGPTAYK